jgi:hypothetical protein
MRRLRQSTITKREEGPGMKATDMSEEVVSYLIGFLGRFDKWVD